MKKKYLQKEFFRKSILVIFVTIVISMTVFQKLAIMNIFYFSIGISSDFFQQLI